MNIKSMKVVTSNTRNNLKRYTVPLQPKSPSTVRPPVNDSIYNLYNLYIMSYLYSYSYSSSFSSSCLPCNWTTNLLPILLSNRSYPPLDNCYSLPKPPLSPPILHLHSESHVLNGWSVHLLNITMAGVLTIYLYISHSVINHDSLLLYQTNINISILYLKLNACFYMAQYALLIHFIHPNYHFW